MIHLFSLFKKFFISSSEFLLHLLILKISNIFVYISAFISDFAAISVQIIKIDSMINSGLQPCAGTVIFSETLLEKENNLTFSTNSPM